MPKHRLNYGLHAEGAETFQQKTAAASRAINELNQSVRKLDATYGKGSKNSDYLSQRSELLTKKLEEQRKKTDALRQGLEQYRASGKASASEIERREKQIRNCEIAEADLTRQIRECSTAMKASKTSLEESLAGLEKYEKRAQKVGNTLTRALTVPIAGMGTIGLKNAMEFEDAMKTVQTLPGVTSGTVEEQAAQLEAYSDAILEASNDTHTAAEELAAAQYSAISSGVAAGESVYMVERAAKAAKAGLSDVETVVDGATSALNAWKDTAGGLDHVLDAMMVAQNVGGTDIDQLASNIGQVTGLAPQLGVALDEVLASVAALTTGGVATSTAFNGLKAVMSNVLKPTAEAKEEAAQLGLEFSAAAMQAKGLTVFLADVMEATNGDAESLGRLFGSTEALSEIMALGTTQAETYADALNQIGNAAGAVDDAFAVKTASKAEQLSGSLNKLRNSGIELAENLFPAVEAGADLLGDMAEFVGDMDEGTQAALVNLLGIAAAAGPAAKGVGGLITAGRTLITLGGKLTAVMSGPWGWVTLGVAGVAALGIAATNTKDSFDELDKQVSAMKLEPKVGDTTALTAAIDAAIDAAEDTHTVTVKAEVKSDFSAVQAEYDSIAAGLDAAVRDAMTNYKLSWDEYTGITNILNGEMLPDAKTALADPTKAAAATGLIAAIDDANALLRALYTSGDTVTEAEVEQLNTLLEQIYAYRAEISGIAGGTANQYAALTAMINSAAGDYVIAAEEYDAIRSRLEKEVAPEAEAAMEDAATAAVGRKLSDAMAELDALLLFIEESGGKASEAQLARVTVLTAEIETARQTIALIRQDTGSVYAEMTRNVASATADYKLTKEEYEAVKKQLDEEVAPEVAKAMEDAATEAVGKELDAALKELDDLMASIAEAGGDASQEEIDRMNGLLAQLAELQTEIATLQGRTELLATWEGELAASDAFRVTAEGFGTQETMSEALGGVIALYRQSMDALAGLKAQYKSEETEAVKGAAAASEADAAKAEYERKASLVQANERYAAEDAFLQFQQLWAGHAESTDENADFADALDRLSRYIDQFMRIPDMSAEDWARYISDNASGEDDWLRGDYDLVYRYLTSADAWERGVGDTLLRDYRAAYEKELADKAEKAYGDLDWEATDLDEMYKAFLDEMGAGFDVGALDPSLLNETFANYLRVLAIAEKGPEAFTQEVMGPLTEGSRWEDYATSPELNETGAEDAGTGLGEAVSRGIEKGSEAAKNAAEGMAEGVNDASKPNSGMAAFSGLALAASLGSGIAAGTPLAVDAARSLAAQVNSTLAGMTPILPGAGLTGSTGVAGGLALAAASAAGSVDNSINVGIQTANFRSASDMQVLADKLNTIRRMKNAGVGNVTRG